MRRSLGLSAYRTLTGRRPNPEYAPERDRPAGELVWIHAAEEGNNRALNDLAHRLVSVRSGCHALLTATHGTFGDRGTSAVIVTETPSEHPAATSTFASHWCPDVAVWAWGDLRPNLIQSVATTGAYLLLVDADQAGFERRWERWLPEVPRHLLGLFDAVIARSNEARTRLSQLGRASSTVAVAPPLRPFGRMLPAADSDVADVSEALGGRPSWLAINATKSEMTSIIAAHRQALKVSHRLLLILQAPDTDTVQSFIEQSKKAGLRVANWDDGDMPDDNAQVLVSSSDNDLGVWLRVSPVAYHGGSLKPGHTCPDPYIAAAHGAAIIYGPYVSQHADAFTQLMNAGAARIVNDAATLGIAVAQMIAPDRAAVMAMAGWDTTTQGADSLDQIIELVQARLDANQDRPG